MEADNKILVVWSDSYATGVEQLDNQHKELIRLINLLYEACLDNKEALGAVFKEIMSRMVDYVRFHFSAEMHLLERINFPACAEHKKQHDELVQKILAAAKDYADGKKFVPNHFVRDLKEWVFGHIAIYDKAYTAYIADQKSKGLLTEAMLS